MPPFVLKLVIRTQRYWRALLYYLPQVRPYISLKRHQLPNSMSHVFDDKTWWTAIVCDELVWQQKCQSPVLIPYLLDKKRKCMLVEKGFGTHLLEQKKREDEGHVLLHVLQGDVDDHFFLQESFK